MHFDFLGIRYNLFNRTLSLTYLAASKSVSSSSTSDSKTGSGVKQRAVRLNINARERRRMHDLNDALDELRGVIPYAHR